MTGPEGAGTRIERWEILPGLPGEGPDPKHFHLRQPTPWREGVAVRFWNEDGTHWVGNFQAGWTEFSAVIELSETRLAVIIAKGACYRLSLNDPERVMPLGDEIGVTGALVSEQEMLILASMPGSLTGVDRNGMMVRTRNDFGTDGLALKQCVSGFVVAHGEDWEGNWRIVRVAEIDGADLP